MKHIKTSIPALLILFTTTACTASPILEDGEWEMTTQMQMTGMPAGTPQLPAMLHRQCLSNDMMVPTQERQNQDCEKMKQDISGNTVTWSMRCTTNGVVSDMNGTSTYSGDSMEGSMHMITQGMEMSSQVTGERIGPCK